MKNHEGQTQIDASSGLFCNPLGHGRKEIIDAITNQLKTLDYAQPFQQGFVVHLNWLQKFHSIHLEI